MLTVTANRNLFIGALLLFVVGLAVYVQSAGNAESDFAHSISKRICELINHGPVETTQLTESRVFVDTATYQLKLIQGTSLLESTTGEDLDGTIEFDKYESPLGVVSGTLNWKTEFIRPREATIFEKKLWSSATNRLKGQLIHEDGDTILVNFSFEVARNPDYPSSKHDRLYDLSRISAPVGTVKIGDRKPINL